MNPANKAQADLAAFGRVELENKDIDPAYPVLAALQADVTPERGLGLTLEYVRCYHLSSSLRQWNGEQVERPPTGVERRGLRDPLAMKKHRAAEADQLDRYGSIEAWLRPPPGTGAVDGWRHVATRYQESWGNGRWAAFKLAEILKVVHGWPLAAPDMGNYGSSGPLAGLALVTGREFNPNSRDQAEADAAAADLLARCRIAGSPALELEQLETLLCDFHAMASGHYYPGHDIDLMQEQADQSPPEIRERILAARASALPGRWLGEVVGWHGRSQRRARYYATTGKVISDPGDGPR